MPGRCRLAHSGLVPFGRYPDQAAAAFNRLRTVLEITGKPGKCWPSCKKFNLADVGGRWVVHKPCIHC